ncbi:MAG TPA: FAD-linked oxidase C-terminal domain-containing protein, partial [Armatimonadota bacterium]|nr:FAD-linked oxidase C-terminal domain-containing protein [Armatimonadota bacterium]
SEDALSEILKQDDRRGEIYRGLKGIRDRYADQIRARYPKIPRRVSGYNLDELLPENGFNVARALVGTESTCVVILEAKVRLVDSPPARSLLVLGYPDVYHAGDHILEVLEGSPIALEGLDDLLVEDMKIKNLHPRNLTLLPEGNGWLLVEFGGQDKHESDERARALMKKLAAKPDAPTMKLFDDPAQEHLIWTIRESGLGATADVPGRPKTWPGWEDSAVPPDKVGAYLRDLRKLFDKFGYHCDLYGHFGQGCVHVRIDFDLLTSEGIARYRQFMSEATDLVVSYGGSLSGEHGDGQSRAQFLTKMFGEELVGVFHDFKKLWDPDLKMNPGKVVSPYQIDQNLRLGAEYNPPHQETYFKFPEDDGSFSRASIRCVGIGDCRRMEHGTMCPSFMATREEKFTTRGRARLLFEMLEGDPLRAGWKDQYVWESLDLCLSCKGCKGDCPVNVDMATYKAEFLSHYYCGRIRPLSAYAFGLIFKWARYAEIAPGIANLLTHAPILGAAFKRLLGIAPEREIPQFAPQTFKQWFRQRPVKNAGRQKVILWPDTFNNYFFPDTAKAAVEVLEACDFQVIVPRETMCCGRPLYDYGLLKAARCQLRQILSILHPYIAAGIPVVGLEPSCIAVFRDELVGLFPDDEDAKRLCAQSFLFSEFIEKHAVDRALPEFKRKAVVHGHCHHKSLMKMGNEESVLSRLKMDFHVLDSGCCGMAGGFGYTKDHYDVSIACGERVLLPAVREADDDTLIIADGFSCREQIAQTTDRHGLHLAEIMHMAMRGDHEAAGQYPESERIKSRQSELKT